MKKATVLLSMCAASALTFAPHLVFAKTAAPAQPSYVELRPADFQKEVDGKQVSLYTIKNKKGMVVNITNYGAPSRADPGSRSPRQARRRCSRLRDH